MLVLALLNCREGSIDKLPSGIRRDLATILSVPYVGCRYACLMSEISIAAEKIGSGDGYHLQRLAFWQIPCRCILIWKALIGRGLQRSRTFR